MRIISGKNKGYRFSPPRKTPARPTTDIAKEGLFNILQNSFDLADMKFLDIFGGTGSISYEMASRGCTDITLVELDRGNINFIKKISAELNFPINILKMDVFKFLKTCPHQYDLVFAGPPYPLKTLNTIPDVVFDNKILAPNGWMVLEHNPNHDFTKHPFYHSQRNYGSTIFAFFKNG